MAENAQFINNKQIFTNDTLHTFISANTIYVEKLSALSANFLNIVLEILKLSSLELLSLSTVSLTAKDALIYRLRTPDLSAFDVNIVELSAYNAVIDTLSSYKIQSYDLIATNLTAENLTVLNFATSSVNVPRLSAQNAFINNLSVQNLTAGTAIINNLSSFRTVVDFLTARNFFTDTFNLSSLVIPSISATQIDVVSLSAQRLRTGTASISTLNVDVRYLSANVDLLSAVDRPLQNVLYVAANGDDIQNDGRNPLRPLRSIKRACQIANNDRIPFTGARPRGTSRYTIQVMAGDYTENNPIYVPTHVSIIGDNLRRVTVRPLNRNYDIFWLDNSAYVWGFTFRDHWDPSAASAFPDLTNARLSSIAFRGYHAPLNPDNTIRFRRPYITTSPYMQGSSSITVGASSNLQTAVSQIKDPTQTNGIAALTAVNRCFETVTDIILYGSLSGDLSYSGAPTTGALAASALLLSNDNFIKKETIAFVNQFYPTLVYDPVKCERDIGFILSAVRLDITTGNNDQSIINGLAYYNGATSVLPLCTVPATIQAVQYAQRLARFVINNETVPIQQAGCGMRVDGSKAEGFLRSMVLDSFTQFNENGKGIHVLNNGYAQLVSIFTICTTEGMLCESGGVMSISNSNCSFGLSGIVARGKSPVPVLTATVAGFQIFGEEVPGTTRTLVFSGVQGTQVFPDSNYYPFLTGAPTFLDTRQVAYTPYNGLVFTLGGNENTLYTIDNNPFLSTANFSFGPTPVYVTDSIERLNIADIPNGTTANFYIRSTAYASSHTFEFIGTSVYLRLAVPALGGVSRPDDEVVQADGGAVYYTSTNQTGDFNVGEDFRIVASTGTIEGRTFQRAILTLVTPLTLALE